MKNDSGDKGELWSLISQHHRKGRKPGTYPQLSATTVQLAFT